jgi:hypothetical protein
MAVDDKIIRPEFTLAQARSIYKTLRPIVEQAMTKDDPSTLALRGAFFELEDVILSEG